MIRGQTRIYLRHLCSERRRHGLHVELARAVVHRHLASLAEVVDVAEALVGHLLEGEAAPQQGTELAVL